jgi:hypothetical protein
MSTPPPEDPDAITAFITEGAHRVATITTNDYGVLLSAQLAQTYLQRALEMLDSKRATDQAMRLEIKNLQASAAAIAQEYAQLEAFSLDYDRFHHLKTQHWIEWISKWSVRAIAFGYLGTVRHHLAYKTQTFHTRLCAVLRVRRG